MKKKPILAILSLTAALSTLIYFTCFANKHIPTQNVQDQKQTFFGTVPINKFSFTKIPCLDVEIDESIFSMELDLGLRGDLAISSEYINQISSKSFRGVKPMWGFRGIKRKTNLYKIPKIRIGPITVFDLILQENSKQAALDGVLLKDPTQQPSPRAPGRLGWELFYHSNLLVDVKNSEIGFCDSLETLKSKGYPTEDFVSATLIDDQGMIELDTITSSGPLRCMLDTGATWNILNTTIEEGKSVDEAFWDPENELIYDSFKINEVDFGPISFHCLSIQMPIHIKAVLGMEFFENNLVFLDFANKKIYFLKQQEEKSSERD